ncbi:c-type cytochrome [Lentisphaera profundi]|uniref:C-type cytochrome n=1 Tax=Lentisphaera profundi TaxID=1658616 RepID=A0ABY7VXD2_9BACT|nr:c-type cytochrome [Lentisphaera profundi]WDE98900.1 c-type cytochrome [Lentisphaera profundi]
MKRNLMNFNDKIIIKKTFEFTRTHLLLLIIFSFYGNAADKYASVKALSPEESLKTIQVPEGYELQVVASEPMIQEPVDCVWDANGNLYVIEMSTYMQDADATGQFDRTSRVMKLSDTDGDGKMDKSSVFIDGLLLPRMILPLDDRILICETNTLDIYAYRDTNNDGKADEKKIWYKGGPKQGNLEHQSSGLIWNLDNWIYITKGAKRFKIVDGEVITDERGSVNTQWGLGCDDDGHFSSGFSGREESFQYFQVPTKYTRAKFPDELEKDFNEVWPIDNIPDSQGGLARIRKDNTLNHMTAACGHAVYRGELMPEFYGNYLICEPVGRLVRMAKIDTSEGYRQLKNPYPKSEFIRATDANFRPVNLKTGPDGALYIVDMYRGIIQEGNWTAKGSYLRGVIDEYGLAKNKKMGRIYRLVPKNHQEKFSHPQFLEMSSKELIPYLGHKNGSIRSTVRKLIVLRNEKTLHTDLRQALNRSENTQEKIELLWTLDGLGVIGPSFSLKFLKNKSGLRLATHGLQLADPSLANANKGTLKVYEGILKNETRREILIQAYWSMISFGPETIAKNFLGEFEEKHALDPVLSLHIAQKARDDEAKRKYQEFRDALKGKGPLFEKTMQAGEKHYKSLCFACHGLDGAGVQMAGTDMMLAAPLKGSKRVLGAPDKLVRIALHGLTGPIEGKTYPGAMEALKGHDNKYLAEVLTYIRNSWGNSSRMLTDNDVRQVRKKYRKRKTPWTIEELEK